MAQTLKTDLGVAKDALRRIGDARLRDFDALWKAGEHHSAVYMAGYAVEQYLKCAVCTTLKVKQLPRVFEYHHLESLLFFSGFNDELRADTHVSPSFFGIEGMWNVEMRYEDPASPQYQLFNGPFCGKVDKWLNDATTGVIPWWRKRI